MSLSVASGEGGGQLRTPPSKLSNPPHPRRSDECNTTLVVDLLAPLTLESTLPAEVVPDFTGYSSAST